MTGRRLLSIYFTVFAAAVAVDAAEFSLGQPDEARVEYSPFINREFPQNVYWGVTHLHTTYSPDAGMVGNFNLGPDAAYRGSRPHPPGYPWHWQP